MSEPTQKQQLSSDQKWELRALEERLRAWMDKRYRHKPQSKESDYLKHFLEVARNYEPSLGQGGWTELEKLLVAIVIRMITAERILGMFNIEKDYWLFDAVLDEPANLDDPLLLPKTRLTGAEMEGDDMFDEDEILPGEGEYEDDQNGDDDHPPLLDGLPTA